MRQYWSFTDAQIEAYKPLPRKVDESHLINLADTSVDMTQNWSSDTNTNSQHSSSQSTNTNTDSNTSTTTTTTTEPSVWDDIKKDLYNKLGWSKSSKLVNLYTSTLDETQNWSENSNINNQHSSSR